MKNTDIPVVSILLPVLNGQQFIEASVKSLLAQKFEKFELIIIDDGSTDQTPTILKDLAKNDARIVVKTHKKNAGLVASLNEGVQLAKADFIARMDADDLSLPWRISRQLARIRSKPDVVMVGCSFEVIDERGIVSKANFVPYKDEDLRRALWLGNPLAHGSMLLRKQAVIDAGGYREVGPMEDYDLWLRMAELGKVVADDRISFQYRHNPNGISLQSNQKQMALRDKNIDTRWRRSSPKTISQQQLKATIEDYMSNDDANIAVGVKLRVLDDVARVGVKLIRYGRFGKGLHQLFIVATSGRTGLKIAVRRLLSLSPKGALKQIS